MNDILDGYAAAAGTDLIARYDGLSSDRIFAPVIDLFPQQAARIADVGAGTGRDAAWFADQGHRILAIEPVRELREAGRKLHQEAGITWLDDRLPDLARARDHGGFDLVTLCAVWQHLSQAERAAAMPNLAEMVVPGGQLIMSLRHGPGAEGRPVHPVDPEATIAEARDCGLLVTRRREAASVQPRNHALGVWWTWLVLERPFTDSAN